MFIVKIYQMDADMRVQQEKNVLIESGDMNTIIKQLHNEPIIKEVQVEVDRFLAPTHPFPQHYGKGGNR